MEQTNQSTTPMGRIWISFLILVSVALIISGLSYYRVEKNRIRLEKYDGIASVAELKVRQIESWRSERLEDARVLAGTSFSRRAILDLVNAPTNEQLRSSVRERLDLESSLGLYSEAFLLDTTGRTLISAGTSPSVMDTSERDAFNETVLERKPVMTDLFRGTNGKVHIDAMAPILNESGRTAAIVVLRCDADNFFYPLINSWPIPSRSAETLLLEKRGDHIVFLNNLRYNAGAALSLRVPLTSTMVPAVQAALGKTGMFEGKDYRGEDVVADIRPVPNTPWFMVAKVDANEILSEANYRGGAAALFIVLFIGISIIATAYAYRHRQAGIYRAMYRAEVERKEVQEEFRTTLYSIGDAVITTDINGLVKQMNPVAERLTGWTEREAKGIALDEVFRIVNEETHAALESPVVHVLKEGIVVGLANHTLLISKNGAEHPIADSGAPIRDESGMVAGVVLIFRDQTKEREEERKVKESESRLVIAELVSKSGNWEFHLDTQTMIVSQGALRIYELKEEKLKYSEVRDVPLPEYRPMMDDALKNLLEKDGHYNIEYKIKAVDTGKIKDIHSTAVFDEKRRIVSGVIQDITDRKRAEEAIRESEENYREIFNSTSEAIFIDDASTGKMIDVNDAVLKMYGYSTKEEILAGNIGDLSANRETYTEEVEQEYIRKSVIGGPQTFEWLARKKDGTNFWLEMTLRRTEIGGKNRILAVGRDITERKNWEMALSESQKMLRTVLDTVPVRVFWKDKNGIYLGCNLAFAKDSGFDSPDEITEKDDFQMGWRDQAELYRADDRQVIESGIPKLSYEEPEPSDKGTRWLRTNKVPLRNAEGEVVGVLGTYEDISETKQATLQLAYERYLLNSLLENTLDPIYFKDTEGHFTRVSAIMVAKRGLTSADELLGKTDFDFFMKERAQKIYEQEQEIVRTGKPVVDVEVQELWTDRPPTWASVTKVPMRDQAGNIVGIFGISRDITERKRFEEALQKSEKQYRLLAESSPEMIYLVGTDGRLSYVNGRAASELHATPQELVGKHITEIFPPSDASRNLQSLQRVIATKSVSQQEVVQEFLSGKKWIDSRLSPVLDENGQVVAVLGLSNDITERKNAEIALRDSEEKFRGLVEGSAAAIWIHDGDRFLYANPAAMEMWGYSAEELYQLAPREIVHPDFREFVMKRAEERMEGKDVPSHYEYQIIKKSGDAIWIDFSGCGDRLSWKDCYNRFGIRYI